MTATLLRRRHKQGGVLVGGEGGIPPGSPRDHGDGDYGELTDEKYNPLSPPEPCHTVECPPVLEEHPLASLGGTLRRYAPSRWVSHMATGKWKGTESDIYKSTFLKMVNYVQHDNFMEHKLPITTPIVVQISVDLVERPGSYPPSMSVGNMRGFWEMFIYLHSSVQDDPYAEPTELSMNLREWNPSGDDEYLAVFRWRSEDGNGSDAKQMFVTLRSRLEAALSQVSPGAVPQSMQKFYYAIYGSPVDRVEEIWIPVKGRALLNSA